MKLTRKEQMAIIVNDNDSKITRLLNKLDNEFKFCKKNWDHLDSLKDYAKRGNRLLRELGELVETFKDHSDYLTLENIYCKYYDKHNGNLEAISEW